MHKRVGMVVMMGAMTWLTAGVTAAPTGSVAAMAAGREDAYSSEEAAAIHKAQQEQRAGHDPAAIALLEPLRAAHPGNGDLPRLLAHSYFAVGRFDDARQAAIDAIALGRLTTDVLARLVQIDQQRGDGVATLNTVRLLVVTEPDNVTWRIVLGDLLTSMGCYGEAEAISRDLLARHPARTDVWLRLGNAMMHEGQNARAGKAYETAWRLGHHDATLATLLAGLAQKSDDIESAIAWTDRAIKLQTVAEGDTQLRLGQLLATGHHDERAKSVARELVKSAPPKIAGQAALLLGNLAMRAGDQDEVIRQWETARKLGVSDTMYLASLGVLRFEHKQYAEAAGCLNDYVAAHRGDGQAKLMLAQALHRSGDQDGAKRALQRYVAQFGMDPAVESLIGEWVKAKTD